MSLIQAARDNIRSLLEQCGVAYEVTPFNEALYQECVDDALSRGYPMDGERSVRTHLRAGVIYGATAGGHLPHRPTQIWISLFTSCAVFVDDTVANCPEEMANVYRFNERFVRNELQGNRTLDAFADIIRRASDLFQPPASHLTITSTLNFIAGTLLEHETRSMQISAVAQKYPTYQRALSGAPDAFSFMAFPHEIPISEYVQALPELGQLICNINDVMSFYKEELVGETTNQVSTLANRTNKSKLEAFGDLTETTIELHKQIVMILERSLEACNVFKAFVGGYIRFHTSTPRYQLDDLESY